MVNQYISMADMIFIMTEMSFWLAVVTMAWAVINWSCKRLPFEYDYFTKGSRGPPDKVHHEIHKVKWTLQFIRQGFRKIVENVRFLVSKFEPKNPVISFLFHLIRPERKQNVKEKDVKEYMQWDSINIDINLNIGNASYMVYTCDFTHDYIDINADYRN